MLIALDRFCFRVLIENSLAMVFSTCILVKGCRCTISMRVVRSGTASCAFINDAPISVSSVNANVVFMILHTV